MMTRRRNTNVKTAIQRALRCDPMLYILCYTSYVIYLMLTRIYRVGILN